MAFNKIYFDQLTDIMEGKDCAELMIIEAMKKYFYPKVLNCIFHYISFGFKILEKFVSSENIKCFVATEKMLNFIKRETKKFMKEALLQPDLDRRSWKFLKNKWNLTKSLIEMDSEVEFSEFATWLLKSIIDFRAEVKNIYGLEVDFNIEENLSYVDDKFSSSASLDIAMKLKSVIQPKCRSYNQVIYPVASYVFKKHHKRTDIKKFLMLIIMAKIIYNKSISGQPTAKLLLESFFKNVVLPSEFFLWAENHLDLKKPKTKVWRQREKMLYILQHLDCTSVYQVLYRKTTEKNLSAELKGIMGTNDLEEVKHKDTKFNVTLDQKDLKNIESNSSVVFTASGPVQMLSDKSSNFILSSSKDLCIKKSKTEENSASFVTTFQKRKRKYNQIRGIEQTSSGNFTTVFNEVFLNGKKVSVNGNKCPEEMIFKNKKRKHTKKRTFTLDCKEPSFKRKKIINKLKSYVHSPPNSVHLPPESSTDTKPRANINKISKKEHLKITHEMRDIENPNLLNGKKSIKSKTQKINKHKSNVSKDKLKKCDEKRNQEDSSMFLKSKLLLPEDFNKIKENLVRNISKEVLDKRSKYTILNKENAFTEPIESSQKRVRRKKKHSDDHNLGGVKDCAQHTARDALQEYDKIKSSDMKIRKQQKEESRTAISEKNLEISKASISNSNIVSNFLKNSTYTKENPLTFHQLQLKEDERKQKLKVIFGKIVDPVKSDSNKKHKTDEDKKSVSESSVDHEDIVLSSLYKKEVNKDQSQKPTEKSESPNSDNEEKLLPYGNDKIEDLEIVFSTIKRDLKNKFVCDIKKEVSLEKDSVPIMPQKKQILKSSNLECHPDNVFNIYSKKTVTVINLDSDTTQDLPDISSFNHVRSEDKNDFDSSKFNFTGSQNEDDSNLCITLGNQIDSSGIIEDNSSHTQKFFPSVNEVSNAKLLSNECKSISDLSEKDENKFTDETEDTSHQNVKEPFLHLNKSKEEFKDFHGNLEESDRSLILTLDESEDSFTNKALGTNEIEEASNIILDASTISNIKSSEAILKDTLDSEGIHISKEILEEKYGKGIEKVSKTSNMNETDEPSNLSQNVSFISVGDSSLVVNNENIVNDIIKLNAETPTSDIISSEILSKENVGNKEKPQHESQNSYIKVLTFETLETSLEQRSEISKLSVEKYNNENEENLENKENIVNNKQEEIVEISYISSNSVNKESTENEIDCYSIIESPKIKATKCNSPMKWKSVSENSCIPRNNLISLTPLKVASAALSNEIIISPDVSDEENTARIDARLQEENIIQSTPESIVTLNQVLHEEEQISDENDRMNINDFICCESESLKEIKNKNLTLANSHSTKKLESSTELATSLQSNMCPQMAPLTNNSSFSSQLRESPKISANSSSIVRSNLTKRSPLIVMEKSLRKVLKDCTIDENNEVSSVSPESREELESEDKVPSPIITRYSLRRNRNITTPQKEAIKPVSRRNSVSSVKSENEIDVKVGSPSASSKKSLTAGILTPVRRSRRISGFSQDKI